MSCRRRFALLQSGNIAPVDIRAVDDRAGDQGLLPLREGGRVGWIGDDRVRRRYRSSTTYSARCSTAKKPSSIATRRFALAWYAQYGYNPASSGDAISQARAKNTSLDGIVDSGIGEARGGKFRLFRRDELADGWSPLDDHRRRCGKSTQHLIAALERSETDAADLLHRLGGYGERARQLAYLLFQKATDKGWADEAGCVQRTDRSVADTSGDRSGVDRTNQQQLL